MVGISRRILISLHHRTRVISPVWQCYRLWYLPFFAYGGIEAVGGLVDKTENPEKNFAKGIVFAAIVISIGYSLAIFLWGVSTNWQQVLSNGSVNLGNITYVLMKSLGMTLGNALHLSPEASLSLGVWFARITGLSMFLAYTGAFFTLCYSPLKAIIRGRRKHCGRNR